MNTYFPSKIGIIKEEDDVSDDFNANETLASTEERVGVQAFFGTDVTSSQYDTQLTEVRASVQPHIGTDVHPSDSNKSENSSPQAVKGVERDHQKSNVKQCNTKKFTFHLSASQYEAIEPTPRYQRLRKPWTNVFYHEFNKKWPKCALKFSYNHCQKKGSRKHGSFWAGRAQCKADSECVRVNFDIYHRPLPGCGVEDNVRLNGTCTHSNAQEIERLNPVSPNRRFLTGDDRMKAAATLRKTLHTPVSLYHKRLVEMNASEIEGGNTSVCQTPQVLKQAAHEYEVKKRLHENVFVELELVGNSWQVAMPGSYGIAGYIQGLGIYPFYVLMYTERQVLAYIEVCKKNTNSVMHLDSTGSVITDITGQKRPYYYCMYNSECKLPALELITTKHSATWISSMIELFCEEVKLLNGRKNVSPKFVVTDFSYALIYATLHAFNNMNLDDYLVFTYNVMMRRLNTSSIGRRTFITLCSAHFSKTLCNRLARCEERKRVRRAAMVMFTLLMRTTSLNTASRVYMNIFVVMCEKYDSDVVESCFNRLKKDIGRGVQDKQEIRNAVDMYADDDAEENRIDDCKEWNGTIKSKSPFTAYFGSAIDAVKINDDSKTYGNLNSMYSPKAFAVIESYIHLYPLWAAALHENVERFATYGQTDGSSVSTTAPKCRTNAVIESHFKSVKHNRKNRRKIRPRLFAKERLKSILARLNEVAITFPSKRKRKLSVADDPSSAKEVWCRKRAKKSYASRYVGLEALNEVRRVITGEKNQVTVKTKASEIINDEHDLSQRNTTTDIVPAEAETERIIASETDSEIKFKPGVLKPEEGNIDKLTDELMPMARSTPVLSEMVPDEFDDIGIQMAHDLLKTIHPHIAGLEFVGLGAFQGRTMPRFSTADGTRFVQIINDGDHWMCVTNKLGTCTHDIFVYDSLQRKNLSTNAVCQISAILRNDVSSSELTVHMRKFARQPARSRACGLYAVAAAFACCNGVDPSGVDYDVQSMRRDITTRLLDESADNIPGRQRWKAGDISTFKTAKVYCICHRKRNNHMTQCTRCEHWFHMQCVDDIPKKALDETNEPWSEPCCRTTVVGDITISD